MWLKTLPAGNSSFYPENEMNNFFFFEDKNFFTELFVIVLYCIASLPSPNIIHMTADPPVCNTFEIPSKTSQTAFNK